MSRCGDCLPPEVAITTIAAIKLAGRCGHGASRRGVLEAVRCSDDALAVASHGIASHTLRPTVVEALRVAMWLREIHSRDRGPGRVR